MNCKHGKEIMACPECWPEENHRRLEAAKAEMRALLALPPKEQRKAIKQIRGALSHTGS